MSITLPCPKRTLNLLLLLFFLDQRQFQSAEIIIPKSITNHFCWYIWLNLNIFHQDVPEIRALEVNKVFLSRFQGLKNPNSVVRVPSRRTGQAYLQDEGRKRFNPQPANASTSVDHWSTASCAEKKAWELGIFCYKYDEWNKSVFVDTWHVSKWTSFRLYSVYSRWKPKIKSKTLLIPKLHTWPSKTPKHFGMRFWWHKITLEWKRKPIHVEILWPSHHGFLGCSTDK